MKNNLLLSFTIILIALSFANAEIENRTYINFCNSNYKELSYGNKSMAISELQKILNSDNRTNYGVGGMFGPSTTKNVKLFQKKNNLLQTGAVGPMTFRLLKTKYCLNENYKDTANVLNSKIPVKEIIEIKNGYTLFEKTISEYGFNNSSSSSDLPSIKEFETSLTFRIGETNLFAKWNADGFNSCNMYEVRKAEIINGKFIPNEREMIGLDLPTSSPSKKIDYMQSVIVKNSTTTATVIQLECINNEKKLIERKTTFIFHNPNVFSF